MSIPIWDQFVQLVTKGLLFVDGFVGNLGLAIIIFTIFLMLLMVPLMLPSLRNARKSQELQPLIKEIQKKHGKDRAAASKEQMELYQQYGFNPMSGCLPVLVQWPFFLALYQSTRAAAETAQAHHSVFLWMTNLANPDPWHLLPILAALAQFFQTKMMMQRSSEIIDPQQKSMNNMMQFMPLMILFIGWAFPAGAVLYYVTSSMFRAILQFFITGWGSLVDVPYLGRILPKREPKRLLPPEPIKDAGTKGAGKGGWMQKFQTRMVEMQQQQQQQQMATKQQQGKAKSSAVSERSNGSAESTQADAAIQSDGEEQEVVVEGEANGIKYTEDAWHLPGAPGSSGKVSLTTTLAGNNGSNASPPRQESRNRQRSRGSRNKKNRRK